MDISAAHSKWNIQYHIVFIPKRRRAILGGRRSERLYQLIKQVAKGLECIVDVIKTDDDNHVHLLIRIPPKHSVSKVMQEIKSKSAQRMLKHYPELRGELPQGTFWARGYYVASVGGLNIDEVREYILLGRLLGESK